MDQKDQAKWKFQNKTEFFTDGRTMRPTPKGVVAFGRTSFAPSLVQPSASAGAGHENWAASYQAKQVDLLREDDRIYKGVNPDGTYLDRIPVKVDKALLDRGEKWFNITCATCHGYEGDGKGMVGKNWSYVLPNFHDPKYRDLTANTGKDGYLFHTALVGVYDQTGKQKMPGYAHALEPMDAWGVVAYIRALQETKMGSINDLPAAQQSELNSRKPAPNPVAPKTAPATTGGGK
jgi:hypothetical protein